MSLTVAQARNWITQTSEIAANHLGPIVTKVKEVVGPLLARAAAATITFALILKHTICTLSPQAKAGLLVATAVGVGYAIYAKFFKKAAEEKKPDSSSGSGGGGSSSSSSSSSSSNATNT